MHRKLFLLLLFFALSCQIIEANQEARLLRFPSTNGKQIAFTYAGDLFLVSATGGVAQRLTTDDGFEIFPHFSPDGKTIAFTAQYDGNTEVYSIPITGGEPKRLTYTATLNRDDLSDRMGPNNITLGWRDNESIIYRSRHKSFNDFKGKLYLASTKGGLSEELPLPDGGFCSYSPDKSKLAYNRVFREFRTWKYYQGGMADDIWIYDFKSKKTEKITDNPHQNIFPMWAGHTIYYLSDRDRIMNLFAYNTETKETAKVTHFDTYDIKFPTLGNQFIVFENGGYIYTFDLASHETKKLTIYINEDFASGRTQLKNASNRIASIDLSPNGKRIAVGARGDVFTVPTSSGITRNLTQTSGVHERNVSWSPNGKWIAYISDKTGEDEIYISPQDGLDEAIQLTKNSDTYKYGFKWSPDSKKILWSDKMQRLRYIDVESKKVTDIEQTLEGELRDFDWSPDSRWIAYSFPRFQTTSTIIIYNVDSKKKEEVTDDWFKSIAPTFSNDGKYLTFISARTFNPTYSWTEWNHSYSNMDNIYLIPLTQKGIAPFAYKNDEGIEENKEKTNQSSENEENKELQVAINFEGIKDRSFALNTPNGSYSRAICIDDQLYYTRRKDGGWNLYLYNLKEKKETPLGDYTIHSITADYKKLLVSNNNNYGVIDVPKSPISLEKTIDLSDVNTIVNLRQEWKQIYNESWRQMRDFFYDPNMHGVNWDAIKNKYAPLVDHVNTRDDLNYIIGEMIGELNCGHAYVNGGDRPSPKRIKTGLLGAELSRDPSGYYKIDKILQGRNWTEELRSPLTENDLEVKEGDYIVAINGKSTKEMTNIYAALFNKADKQVELAINAKATEAGSQKVIVKPIADEGPLYYFNWVQNNIEKVNKATNGEVGYIHIPDMGVGGLNEFIKYFYPQLNKKALIIDDRGNGGGNVSPMIIERLRREVSMMAISRNGRPNPKPEALVPGPKVLLIDKYSASDGDLFPYQFKYHKLGKIIGVRSWGGVVGIRGSLPFIDGGSLNRPEFAHFNAEGSEFIIEGYGVDPDIVIDNDPAKEYAGEDQQLNKAIEVVLEELKTNPGTYPNAAPNYPNKAN